MGKKPKQKKEPFAEFEDWLEDGIIEDWHDIWIKRNLFTKEKGEKAELTPEQKRIIKRNAELLLNREKWEEKVERFEKAISTLDDETEQNSVRSQYVIHFDEYVFNKGSKDFKNYRFPCDVCFYGANFGEGDVDFRWAKFRKGEVDFQETKFGEGNVSFRWVEFEEGNVDFTNADFGRGKVDFSKSNFGEGAVYFSEVKFGEGDVNFHMVNFGEGDVYFSEADFGNGNINFEETNFGNGDINFYEVKFGEGGVSFEETNFGEGDVGFGLTDFRKGYVIFNRAIFGRGHVDFDDTKFGGNGADFSEVNFGEGSVSFELTEFSGGDIAFTNSEIRKGFFTFYPSKFEKTSFDGSRMIVDGSLILGGNFDAEFSFEGLTVTNTTTLHNVEFEKVPDFRNASFGRTPEVSGMEVSLSDYDKKSCWSRQRFKHGENSEDASKFRKLKVMAIDNHDHEESLKYFAYEMMAKRGTETRDFVGLLINSFYCMICDYGQNVMRPLLCLIVIFVIFTVLYFFQIECSSTRRCTLFDAALISFHNSLPFLGNLRPDSVMNWSIVQNIFSSIFIFFILLTLRNRFRIK